MGKWSPRATHTPGAVRRETVRQCGSCQTAPQGHPPTHTLPSVRRTAAAAPLAGARCQRAAATTNMQQYTPTCSRRSSQPAAGRRPLCIAARSRQGARAHSAAQHCTALHCSGATDLTDAMGRMDPTPPAHHHHHQWATTPAHAAHATHTHACMHASPLPCIMPRGDAPPGAQHEPPHLPTPARTYPRHTYPRHTYLHLPTPRPTR